MCPAVVCKTSKADRRHDGARPWGRRRCTYSKVCSAHDVTDRWRRRCGGRRAPAPPKRTEKIALVSFKSAARRTRVVAPAAPDAHEAATGDLVNADRERL